MEQVGKIVARHISSAKLYQSGWFKIHRHIIDQHAKIIGANGLGLYVALLSHQNSINGKCYPSTKRLAGLLGLDQKTITKHLKTLENNGLIVRNKLKGRSTSYGFPIESLIRSETPIRVLGAGRVAKTGDMGTGSFGNTPQENFHPNKNKEQELNNKSKTIKKNSSQSIGKQQKRHEVDDKQNQSPSGLDVLRQSMEGLGLIPEK